jgi:uncharacterized membrane protein
LISLLAIGGALTVLRSTDEVLNVVATLPVGIPTTACSGRSNRSGSR